MKKILLMLSLFGALLLALSVPAAAAGEPVVYMSYNGSNLNDGLTPQTPKRFLGTSSGTGVMSLLQNGGTLVVVGKGYIGETYVMEPLSNTLTITSVYDGVDYKNSLPEDNPSCCFKMAPSEWFAVQSDVVFDDIILFQEGSQNTLEVKSGATLTVTDSVILQSRPGLDFHYKLVINQGGTAILSEEAQEVFTIENRGGTLLTYVPPSYPDPDPEPDVSLEDLAQYANADAYLHFKIGTDTIKEYGGFFSDGVGYSSISTSGTLPSSGSMLSGVRVIFPVSISGNGTYLFNYNFSVASLTTTYAGTRHAGSVVVYYSDGTSYSIPLKDGVGSTDGFYFQSSDNQTGSSSHMFIFYHTGNIVISDPNVVGFMVNYSSTSSTSSTAKGGVVKVETSPVTVVNVSDTTLTDVVSELNKVVVATQSSSVTMSSAISDMTEILKKSSADQTEALKVSLGELQSAIKEVTKTMASAVEEGTENAIEKFYEKVKKEASDQLASALSQIQEAMPVDVKALQGSFDELYQSMSTHEKNAIMTFPAGELTLMGQTYRFWEPQQISFNQYFELPGMSLLLIPLRFMFVFGMGKYLMAYFGKIEKLITLHTDGGGD